MWNTEWSLIVWSFVISQNINWTCCFSWTFTDICSRFSLPTSVIFLVFVIVLCSDKGYSPEYTGKCGRNSYKTFWWISLVFPYISVLYWSCNMKSVSTFIQYINIYPFKSVSTFIQYINIYPFKSVSTFIQYIYIYPFKSVSTFIHFKCSYICTFKVYLYLDILCIYIYTLFIYFKCIHIHIF